MKTFHAGLMGLLMLALQLGCCGIPGDGCGPCGGGVLQGGLASRFAGIHCTSGCGEVYWDEQINEPRTCDPCGNGGEFVGGVGCGRCPGGLSRIRSLFGTPYLPDDCGSCSMSACDSCVSTTSSGCSSCSSGMSSHRVHSQDSYAPQSYPIDSYSAPKRVPAAPSAPARSQPTPAAPKASPVADPTTYRAPAGRRAPTTVAVGSGVAVQHAQHRR